MKKILCAVLAALLLFTMAGCGTLFEKEYHYEEPMTGELGALSGDAKEIRNFSMLKTALTDMISRHEEHGEFRLNRYNGSPSEDLATACFEIKSEHPLGAYAVETISYDTSYVVSYYVASIYISYKRTAEEVQQIVYVLSQSEFDETLLRAVGSFEPQVVARLYSSQVDETYIRRLVKRYCYDNPVILCREPELTVSTYPLEGINRIYDVQFDYTLGQAANMALSLALSNRLNGAVAGLTETEPVPLALECAAYLSGLSGEGEGRYPDTAYGALVEHAADAKGMALAYRALCDRLDIPCIVVEGVVRSLGMAPHFWNIITLDGENYHVDVSAFGEDPARAFLCSDDAFWGAYIWETEDYPPCNGTLRYSDAVQQEDEDKDKNKGENMDEDENDNGDKDKNEDWNRDEEENGQVGPTEPPETPPTQEPVPEETAPPSEDLPAA